VHLLLDANRGLRYESYRAVPARVTRNGKVEKYIKRHDRIMNGPGKILSKFLMLSSDLAGRSQYSREIVFCQPNKKPLSALEYLAAEGGNNIRLSFCKLNPNCKSKIMKSIVPYFPRQILEILSTFHVKLNVVDNKVIMTGANLGEDYFKGRKDRCIAIESSSLAQSLHDWAAYLVKSPPELADKGARLNIKSEGTNEDKVNSNEVLIGNDTLLKSLDILKRRESDESEKDREWSRINNKSYKAIILPRVHHYSLENDYSLSGILGMPVLEKAFDRYGLPSLIATAYFNPTVKFFNMMNKLYCTPGGEPAGAVDEGTSCANKMTDDGSTSGKVLKQRFFVTAAKESNSFNHGLKRGVTESYERILRKKSLDFCNQWQILEWYKQGRSFHSKGIWWMTKDDNNKSKAITDIGSSNYTVRSVNRDLELNFLVKTRHPQEIRMLRREYKSIINDGKLPRWLNLVDRSSVYNWLGQATRSRWIRSFL